MCSVCKFGDTCATGYDCDGEHSGTCQFTFMHGRVATLRRGGMRHSPTVTRSMLLCVSPVTASKFPHEYNVLAVRQCLIHLMHPCHSSLYLGLHQSLQLLAQEVFHGHLVGLHFFQVLEQPSETQHQLKRKGVIPALLRCVTLCRHATLLTVGLNARQEDLRS